MNTALSLSFRDVHFDVVDRNGQPWLRSPQIGEALGYAKGSISIHKLYEANAEEFTDAMTALVKLHHGIDGADLYPRNGEAGQIREVRIFSLRGCHLLAMFARTEIAKEFRKWVLDVLDQQTGGYEAPNFRDPLSDFGPKAQFAVLEMLVGKVAKEIADGFIGYLRTQPGRFTPEPAYSPVQPAQERPKQPRQQPAVHDFQNARQKVLDFIAARKGQGAGTSTLYRLCRAYRNLPDDKRKELISQLLSDGEIVEVFPESQPGARRKAVIYVAKAFAEVVQ